jgi:hypothetical protein
LQKSCQLAKPKKICRKFSVLYEKFVCAKFPVYTENKIFFSIFADGRIKPKAQSYQPKIPEKLSAFCTVFQISKKAN